MGLAVGMTCVILIFLWIQDEMHYDRFHEKAERIYRVIMTHEWEGKRDKYVRTAAGIGSALVNDYPDIVDAVTIDKRQVVIQNRRKRFFETVLYTDPQILTIFTFSLAKGDTETALSRPNTIVISEEMSHKYFGNENPIGKVLTLNERKDYTVTGVMNNIPHHSHLHFHFLVLFYNKDYYLDQYGVSNFYTYILTSESFNLKEYMERIDDFTEKYRSKESRYTYKLRYEFQPLTSIHLYSNIRGEFESNGSIVYVMVFSGIAVLILLIACFNHVNLSTALYTKRQKEVGIRKVVGANRRLIMNQFLGESLLITLLSFFVGIMLVSLFLPLFNTLTGKALTVHQLNQWVVFIGLPGLMVLVGLCSGFYPSLYMSALRPERILKGTHRNRLKGQGFRRVLIVAQFTVSVLFIACTLVINNQLHYIRTRDLGFDKEQILHLKVDDTEVLKKLEAIKGEFLQNPDILSVSATDYSPGSKCNYSSYWCEGRSDGSYDHIRWVAVDRDFIKTYGIQLTAGRDFSGLLQKEGHYEYILNESAVEHIGWEEPIGKKFNCGMDGRIIGVVKDFHFRTLHHPVEPIVLKVSPYFFKYISVRMKLMNIPQTIKFLREKWETFAPDQTFDFSFFDEAFDQLYKTEARMSQILGYSTAFAIGLACLGLFGLVTLVAEFKTKEIGIRKVLGASVSGIVTLLSKEFVVLVCVANVVAWPGAWLLMNKWLQNFAYRIHIAWWMFVISGALAMVIALLTVGFQAIKAATANPVESLRYE
jgi:putative ABC transport system permease protein